MKRRSFLFLSVGLLLTGCGGGGSGSNSARFQPPESPDGISRVRRIDPEAQHITRPPSVIDVYIENTTDAQIRGATLKFGGVERSFQFFHNGSPTQWRVRFSPLPVDPSWVNQSLPVEITLSDGTSVIQDDPPTLFKWNP